MQAIPFTWRAFVLPAREMLPHARSAGIPLAVLGEACTEAGRTKRRSEAARQNRTLPQYVA